jgi:hypothetical protein
LSSPYLFPEKKILVITIEDRNIYKLPVVRL